jgi:hypothetical protein
VDRDLVEVLLRNSRPEVRPDFHDALEEKLFQARRPALRMPRLPCPVLVAAAAASAMVAGVLGLSLRAVQSGSWQYAPARTAGAL